MVTWFEPQFTSFFPSVPLLLPGYSVELKLHNPRGYGDTRGIYIGIDHRNGSSRCLRVMPCIQQGHDFTFAVIVGAQYQIAYLPDKMSKSAQKISETISQTVSDESIPPAVAACLNA